MESSLAHLTGVENRLEIRKRFYINKNVFNLFTGHKKILSNGRTELVFYLLGYAGLIFFRHLPKKA